jgi:YebC/PmpR family DNA-binding regulatory protein
MSGHHNIEKGANDAVRGKIFTRHGNLITLAARKGGDPSMNSSLRLAIDNAKKDNFPNVNIDRAIKRGTGELKGAAEISEISYEGYGPAGIAVIVECLTDNKNRTITNVRTVFTKRGGNIGSTGSVGWMFDRKGLIVAKANGKPEEVELMAIDAGADDIKTQGETVEIYTPFNALHQVVGALKSKGLEIEKAEVTMKPKEPMKIEDETKAKNVLGFIAALEEDMDVTNVYTNADISAELMAKIGA